MLCRWRFATSLSGRGEVGPVNFVFKKASSSLHFPHKPCEGRGIAFSMPINARHRSNFNTTSSERDVKQSHEGKIPVVLNELCALKLADKSKGKKVN